MDDPLYQACSDRDELRRRVLRIASALGIGVDDLKSEDVQGSWLELCDRIDAKLASRRIIDVFPPRGVKDMPASAYTDPQG